MAIWDVCNPSDPVTFETDSYEAAALAVLLVGEGFYPSGYLRLSPQLFAPDTSME